MNPISNLTKIAATMKPSLLSLIPILCATVASAQTSIPNFISYQARLADASGLPIGNDVPVNRTVILRVYSSATGGSPLYAEQQIATISKGQLSVLLGTGLQVGSEPRDFNNVFAGNNGTERFLGVTVDDGTPTADPEVSPRQQVVSTAYALRARNADVASSVVQSAGESSFNITHANGSYLNGNLVMNGNNQIFLGGGAAGANGALLSTPDYTWLYGRGGDDNSRRILMEAKGGTNFTGPISFFNRLGQHINLWGNGFGLGIQSGTLYQRTAGNFAWFQGGSHADGAGDAGGGLNLAVLNGGGLAVNTGGLQINAGGINVNAGNINLNNGSVLNGTVNGTLNGTLIGTLNGIIDRGSHGPFAQSFGGGHSFGSQDWTTYARSARNFAWYLGGNWNGGENNPGGGTTLALLDATGLRLRGEGGNSTAIELGYGVGGKEGSAGIIAYKRFSGGLDIVGAGTTGDNRQVTIFAEGGTTFTGPINLQAARRFANYGLGGNADTLTNDGVQATNGFQTVSDVVLGALGGRIVADRFTAISDARIKNITGLSNAALDLATLMKVQITDYKMKDDKSAKPRQNKKVIAQQVEEVFPQAVSTMPGAVPDLLTTVSAKVGFVTLTKALPATVKKGDVLQVWSDNRQAGGVGCSLTTVTEVTKDGFQLKDKLDGKILLYGHQVNDLRSVDYEAISMLNVSATQELNRTIEQQAAKIKQLEDDKAALEKKLSAATAVNEAQDTRLASIEKALKQQSPATAPTTKEKSSEKVATRR